MKHFPSSARQIDRAIAGLITDLKQRGLFEETLIVCGRRIWSHPHDAKQREFYLEEGPLRT